MELKTRVSGEVRVVSLRGRFDTASAGEIADALDQVVRESPAPLLIDLAGLDFMSSAGLRVILRTARRLSDAGGELKLCGASGVVREVIELSGLGSLLEIFEDEATALASY